MSDEKVSVKIAVDGGRYLWYMHYEIRTPYTTIKFHDKLINNNMSVGEWRDFISGEGPDGYYGCSITRHDKTFEFNITDVEDSWVEINIDKKYLVGPLSDAIDEAVHDGFFGEEARYELSSSCIKGCDD